MIKLEERLELRRCRGKELWFAHRKCQGERAPQFLLPPRRHLAWINIPAPAHDADMETEPGSEDSVLWDRQNPESLWERQETFCI